MVATESAKIATCSFTAKLEVFQELEHVVKELESISKAAEPLLLKAHQQV